MKNRIIALLIVLTIILACFASCGGGGNTEPDNGGSNNTSGDTNGGNNNPGNNNDNNDDNKTPVVPGDDDTVTSNYPWKETTLIFSINEDSDNDQLPSSSRRYLAGDLTGITGAGDKVDQFVADRNSDALKATNVKVVYDYLLDKEYTWGQSITYINEFVNSGDVETPDVFISFVYDMVACSLLRNFANLKSEKMYKPEHELFGKEYNYFEFVNPTADTAVDDFGEYEDTGVGYMYEYMRSLTLSKSKMYCLSSDYFIDMVRAFFAIPVNVGVLEQYVEATSEAGKFNSDRAETFDDNGEIEKAYTIEDLYELVNAGEWNYDALAKFSDAVASDAGDGTVPNSERLGFALGTDSGLAASGMLYTTPITIVKRTYSDTTGEYTYAYPNMQKTQDANGKVSFIIDKNSNDKTFEELEDFCERLTNLMSSRGVVIASEKADGVHSAESIRTAFRDGRLLFGGVIVIGALEHKDYIAMNGDGKSGYGILPVPLYSETLGAEDYLTQIHNNGKIGAISYTTKKFAQCTAYLNYQSTHSNEILTQYYNYTLSNLVEEGGVGGNTEMLQLLRDNVRSSFDKAYEDVIGEYYFGQTNGQSRENEWHNVIKNQGFKDIDIVGQYESIAGTKANHLYGLEVNTFPGLPE